MAGTLKGVETETRTKSPLVSSGHTLLPLKNKRTNCSRKLVFLFFFVTELIFIIIVT